MAGLLAVAVFGLVLYTSFNHSLDRRLNNLALSSAEREAIDRQRPKLAAAESDDWRVQRAIAESFVSGYRVILLIATGLTVTSALSAVALLASAQTE